MTLARVVESLLFSAQKPLSAKEMVDVIKRAGQVDELSPNEFAKVRESEVAAAVEELKIEYGQQERAFQLVEKARSCWPYSIFNSSTAAATSDSRTLANSLGESSSTWPARLITSTISFAESGFCALKSKDSTTRASVITLSAYAFLHRVSVGPNRVLNCVGDAVRLLVDLVQFATLD